MLKDKEEVENFMLQEYISYVNPEKKPESFAENAGEFHYLGAEITPNLRKVNSWGGEGEGDSIGYVLETNIDGVIYYLLVNGYYDSWNGTDWDYAHTRLVKPVQKLVTVYE